MQEILNALKKQNILELNEIQKQSIPIILDNKDLILNSNTGTGKTLSYVIPIITKIDFSNKNPQFVIIAPTHELASQIYKQFEKINLELENKFKCALIIGGANINRQIEILREKPQIIIGNCGRILELYSMKKLKMHFVKSIIIDEADRMLDDLNFNNLKKVVKTTLKDRQLLFISATVDNNFISKVNEICNESLTHLDFRSSNENIKHIAFECERRYKIDILRKIINTENINKCIVFVNNKEDLQQFVSKLNYHNIKSVGLYGSMLKRDRKQSLLEFINGNKKVLVATDLASRGLDIDIDYVINMDVPENPNFYTHRAGRTGRANKKGVSILIATKRELTLIKSLENKLNIKIQLN